MPTTIDDGAQNRSPFYIGVDDGGVWRTIQEIWVDDGSAWRLVYPNAVITLTGGPITRIGPTGGTRTATLRLEADGDIAWNQSASTNTTTDQADWINPKSAASGSYEVRATLDGGALSTGNADGTTWQSLGSDVEWTVSRSSLGISSATITLEIRHSSSPGVILDSAQYFLEVTVENN